MKESRKMYPRLLKPGDMFMRSVDDETTYWLAAEPMILRTFEDCRKVWKRKEALHYYRKGVLQN